MGCGSSKDPKIGVADSIKPVENYKSSQNNFFSNTNSSYRNGFKHVELKTSEDISLKRQYNKSDEKSKFFLRKKSFQEPCKTFQLIRSSFGFCHTIRRKQKVWINAKTPTWSTTS